MAPPDADLYPHASGLAADLVSAHTSPQPLKLYAGWFCPFVQRAWLVLEEKKIPYQYIEVNPYHKPESLMKLNPRGLVPTLEYDGKPLYESTVICEFLEDTYPDRSLRPKDKYDVAKGRIWQGFVETRVVPAFHRFLQWQPEGKKTIDEVREEFLSMILQFVEAMDSEGPYFFGKDPMLVDIIMAPWAMRLWIFDEFKAGGLGIPKGGGGGANGEKWARWSKWLRAIEGRDSIKSTLSEKKHYMPIYKR